MLSRIDASPAFLSLIAIACFGCGGDGEEKAKSNVCIYEHAECQGPSSTIVGDQLIYLDGTCPVADSDYETRCGNMLEVTDCSGFEHTRTSDFEGATFYEYDRKPYLVRGVSCEEWEKNPSAYPPPGTTPTPASGGSGSMDAGGGLGSGGVSGGGGGSPGAGGTPETCPFECPATAEAEASCWEQSVTCTSVTSCGTNDVFACVEGGQTYDCAADVCIACSVAPSDDPCQECLRTKCCATAAACAQDTACRACAQTPCAAGEQPAYDTYVACAETYCGGACQ